MDLTLFEYVVYLGASVVLTVWVGRTLYVNGRRFLVEVMADDGLAESVNHLLLVGFYLVNIGVAALLVNATGRLETPADMVRTLATQLGIVLLVLGGMHFTNLFVLQRLRHSSQVRAYSKWYYAQGPGRGQRTESGTPAPQ
jgi:hypothetical protein